jgi:hypothetical protein
MTPSFVPCGMLLGFGKPNTKITSQMRGKMKTLKIFWCRIVNWFTFLEDSLDHPEDAWNELDSLGFLNKNQED